MKLGNITKQIRPAAGAIAGAIASKVLKSKALPATLSPMTKNAIPAVVGLVLMSMKGAFVQSIGIGMVAESGSGLATDFVPGLAGFTGDDISDAFDTLGEDLGEDLGDELTPVGEFTPLGEDLGENTSEAY